MEGILDRKARVWSWQPRASANDLGEGVFFAMVKSQHTGDAVAAAERTLSAGLELVFGEEGAEMKGFGGRIAVGDRLLVASDPTGKTLSQRDAQ